MAVDWSQPPNGVTGKPIGPIRARMMSQYLWTASNPHDYRSNTWPKAWRDEIVIWLKATSSTTTRWATLCKKLQGHGIAPHADDALLALIRGGYVQVEVRHKGPLDPWRPCILTWLRSDELRNELGMPSKWELRATAEQLLRDKPSNATLSQIFESLSAMPADLAIRRAPLIRALDEWITSSRKGTFRDLGLRARDKTKTITASERDWLALHLDLAAIGLEPHQPVYWLGGLGVLKQGTEPVLNLTSLQGFAALSRSALASIESVDGIARVLLIENRTSFERQTHVRAPGTLYVWLPGYVGAAWLEGLAHLLRLVKTECLVAADCDPWGVDIALSVGQVCDQVGSCWRAFQMDPVTLNACPHQLELSESDRKKIAQLQQQTLPYPLDELCVAMLALNKKAEQEQYL